MAAIAPTVPIALFYFCWLGALGLFMPYFSIYLADAGLPPSQITLVLALSPTMALVVPPFFGLLADARAARGWLLRLLGVGSTLGFLALLSARRSSVLGLALAAALFAFFRAPVPALWDATALDCARRSGGSYGRLRLWGSLGFVFAVGAGGELLETHGLPSVMLATLVALACGSVVAWILPTPPLAVHRRVLADWLTLLSDRQTWLFLGAIALAQAAGAGYDSCYSLHLASLGHKGRFIGGAWALGVVAEIGVLAISGRLLGRFSAARLFGFSLATATVRWLLLALTHSPTGLLALQPLHGITFGLFYVSAVTLMRERAAGGAPTAAQGLLATAFGLGSVVGMALAGWLLQSWGGSLLYGASSAMAALATACAAAYARAGSAGDDTMARGGEACPDSVAPGPRRVSL